MWIGPRTLLCVIEKIIAPDTTSNRYKLSVSVKKSRITSIVIDYQKYQRLLEVFLLLWACPMPSVTTATKLGLMYLYNTDLSLKTLPWECTRSIGFFATTCVILWFLGDSNNSHTLWAISSYIRHQNNQYLLMNNDAINIRLHITNLSRAVWKRKARQYSRRLIRSEEICALPEWSCNCGSAVGINVNFIPCV